MNRDKEEGRGRGRSFRDCREEQGEGRAGKHGCPAAQGPSVNIAWGLMLLFSG